MAPRGVQNFASPTVIVDHLHKQYTHWCTVRIVETLTSDSTAARGDGARERKLKLAEGAGRGAAISSAGSSVLARFGHALSDPTRARILLALRNSPSYPSDLADLIGVSRQSLSNHLTCLRGCGLVVAVPEGRRSRYELADPRLAHALTDLMSVVLAVDPEHSITAGRARR